MQIESFPLRPEAGSLLSRLIFAFRKVLSVFSSPRLKPDAIALSLRFNFIKGTNKRAIKLAIAPSALTSSRRSSSAFASYCPSHLAIFSLLPLG